MPRVSIHAPKTPVTKGSNGIAMATVPNICKMPGPPAPFVPTPLPNIGRSGDSPKGYSTSVTIDGQPVAIEGCSFGSQGDIASKGTGGGLVPANPCGPTTFIGPGTMDVRTEGMGVHLFGDPMFNNCGPSGSPPNAATMAGLMQPPLVAQAVLLGVTAEVQEICDIKCDCQAKGEGEDCIYKELKRRDEASGYTRTTKPQVPYEMKPAEGGPPRPYMSKNDPRRPTTNWFIPGHRRPDAVIVSNGTAPPYGNNIRAVVEVKLGNMGWSKGQKRAYQRIAGKRENLIVVDDDNCKCPNREEPEPEPVPVMVEKPARERSRATTLGLSPVAALVGAVAAVAVVVALVAAAPVTATAAAAVVLVAVSSGSEPSSGGSDAI